MGLLHSRLAHAGGARDHSENRTLRCAAWGALWAACACFGPGECCGPKKQHEAHKAAEDDDKPGESLAAAANPTGGLPDLLLLDGMGGENGATDGPRRIGYWYSYSDGTGHILPAAHSQGYPVTSFRGRVAREFKGGGQGRWGAGFGFDLNDVVPRLAGAGATAVANPMDLSAYTAIRFDAVSKMGPVNVIVALSDVHTDVHGGVCDPNSSKPKVACGGDYNFTVQFPSGAWERRTVWFSQLTLPAWTELAQAKAEGFRKERVYAVHFQLAASSAPDSELAPFDILVGAIYLIREPAPAASQ